MSDRFHPISMETLTDWIFDELDTGGSIFGIPADLFYRPSEADPYRQTLYGDLLETPFGVAAGPHSQMAQNLVVAWLCGARFMELKTVQTLDELEISKPCIDMQDEGYNVEWSQELKVHESYEEYLRAWVLIHALHRKLGFPGDAPGVIFNMSVGYDNAGLHKPNMQWYLDKVADAGEDLPRLVEVVARRFPEVRDLEIPSRLCNSVTVSTMHGCPPGEIGDICAYLIAERELHTNVKLNPTLLGPARVREILNETLGFDGVIVPDEAFGHDLKYVDAVPLIQRLIDAADEHDVVFGLKLSNTLEVENHRSVFDAKEKMMYLSGRPLHAITTNLAAKLSGQFDGKLLLSFAGGVNALNAPHLMRTGMRTVTTCSDILKSGGYLRMLQYIENTAAAMAEVEAGSLDDLVVRSATRSDWLPEVPEREAPGEDAGPEEAALYNLRRYADAVLADHTLMRDTYERHRSKTPRTLDLFDCVEAPCMDECAVNQKVPTYMNLVRERRFDEAVAVTRGDNPMASVLGRACDHVCEVRCVRTHYDEPLAIREIKRFIIEHEGQHEPGAGVPGDAGKVAVIGGGPCGLAAASTLASAGYAVTVFEAHEYAGGMTAGTIPVYRTPQFVIDRDLDYLASLGVEIRCGQRAGEDFTIPDLREQGYQDVVVAIGAQTGLTLGIDGEDGPGVWEGLHFLREARHGETPEVGKRVGIIGGGDVSMDCARTAMRLGAEEVTVIYRRTVAEMPAQKEELDGFLEEGGVLKTLVSPKRVVREGDRLTALIGSCMKLGEPDESGRRRPVATGDEVEIPLDCLITAIGQRADLSLFGKERPAVTRKGYLEVDPVTLETSVAGVYAGGDVAKGGPESIVKAMGDGQRIAAGIIRRGAGNGADHEGAAEVDVTDLLRRRARLEHRVEVPHRDPAARIDFGEVVDTYSEEQAVAEASRCLDCDVMCSICTGVCPNLAFLTYQAESFHPEMPVYRMRDGALEEAETSRFSAEQGFQVAVLTDFCNECGNCETFCPTADAPYRSKPRLYLDRQEFLDQDENAFMVTRTGEAWKIEGRFDGRMFELVDDGELHYTSPRLTARLDPDGFRVKEVAPGDRCREGDRLTLDYCATLFFLLRSLRVSRPWFPVARGGAE